MNMNVPLLAITLCCAFINGEEVRLINLDPPEAQQYIDKQDTSLKYAPKIESNVPAVRYLGNEPHNVQEDIYLANQYHGQDGLGGYLYGYSVPDIAKTEKKKAGGDLRGAYNYIAGNGKEIKVEYWDDGTGFHQVDNVDRVLPQQIEDTPEVKAAKEEHQRLWNEQAERNSRPIENPYDSHGNYAPGVGPQSQAQHLVNQYQQQKQQFPNPGQNVHYQGDQTPQYQGQGSQNVNRYQPGGFGGGQIGGGGKYGGGLQGGGQYGTSQLPSSNAGQYGGQSGSGQFDDGQLGGQPGGGQFGAQHGSGQLGGGQFGAQHGSGQLGSGQFGAQQGGGQLGGQPGGGQFGGGQLGGQQGGGAQLGVQHGGGISGGAQLGQYGGQTGGNKPFGGSQSSSSSAVQYGGAQFGGPGETSGQFGSASGSLSGYPSGSQGGGSAGQFGGNRPGGSGQYGGSQSSGGGQFSGSHSSGGQYSGSQSSGGGHYGGYSAGSETSKQYASGQYSGGQDEGGYKEGQDEGRYNEQEEEQQGPPKGFFYSFDYPVGILVQKGAAIQKREGDLKDIYATNKAEFEKQLQQGYAERSTRSSSGYLFV